MHAPSPDVDVVTRLPTLPARDLEGHKGSYGRVLVVAGSRGMTGAAVLCASAALRGGAGLVFLAVPETVLPIVAAANPCYLTVPLPDDGRGRHTAALVTAGRRLARNTTGNPGMATGGTGDVLAGLIGALIGQGLEPFAAAQLGVWLHGRAGDLARDDLGEVSLIASDLLDYLPRAFRSLPGGEKAVEGT